jgi:hypothetical protein
LLFAFASSISTDSAGYQHSKSLTSQQLLNSVTLCDGLWLMLFLVVKQVGENVK